MCLKTIGYKTLFNTITKLVGIWGIKNLTLRLFKYNGGIFCLSRHILLQDREAMPKWIDVTALYFIKVFYFLKLWLSLLIEVFS